MTFWDWVDRNPGWTLLYLIGIGSVLENVVAIIRNWNKKDKEKV